MDYLNLGAKDQLDQELNQNQARMLQLVKDLMEPKPIVELQKVLGILLMNSYDF